MKDLEKGKKGEAESENYSTFQPLVSVITVVKNSGNELRRTIQTTLSQNYSNIEYIIVDGGSNRTTLDIIKEYENEIDVWISEKDQGIYDAMNKGIRLSKGDIIGFVNAGDYYYPGVINKIIKFFSIDKKVELVYGEITLCDGFYREIYNSSIKNRPFKDGWLPHPAVFIKKDVYMDYGYYNSNLKISGDYEFMLRINKIIKKKYINDSLVAVIMKGASTNNILLKVREDYYARRINGFSKGRNLFHSFIGVISPLFNSFVNIIISSNIFRFENTSLIRKLQSHRMNKL